jgi:hypothetical protein
MREAAKRERGIDIYVSSGWRPMKWPSREEYEKWIYKNKVENESSSTYYRKVKKAYEQDKKVVISDDEAKKMAFAKAEGMKAYISPHMSGMALDLYIEPIEEGDVLIAESSPSNNYKVKTRDSEFVVGDRSVYGGATRQFQRISSTHKWLEQNAYKFGFSPLKGESYEPWHWECLLTIDAWKTGNEYTNDYSKFVNEQAKVSKKITSKRNFTYE